MEYIEIGQIVNTNGLKGVVKVNPFTDDISKFEDLKYVYIQLKNELKKVKIEQVRYNKNQVLLKLEGIDSIEEAEKYRNFYEIARNYQTRSLNIDKSSVYFFGRLKNGK